MRVKCPCGSHLFFLHVPPKGTETGARVVYLICEGCRKAWEVKLDALPEVDENGVIRPEFEYTLIREEELTVKQKNGG